MSSYTAEDPPGKRLSGSTLLSSGSGLVARAGSCLAGLASVACLFGLACLGGCWPSNELGGAAIPNAMPDTRVTATPPSLLESGFIVHFYWTGSDPDGEVHGYQWKMSENGTDGISVHDTMTVDPGTGAVLHPWRFTTATDTVFIISADIPGFPGDQDLPPRHQRSWQTHTLFVRTMDTDGGVDPTPANVSFTATTLIPRIVVDRPERLGNYRDAQAAPRTVTFGYTGNDPDFSGGGPTEVRFLFKKAWYQDHYVRTKYEFDQLVDELCSFSDSGWSGWQRYNSLPENRLKSYPDQPDRDSEGRQITYLFALQAADTAGALSVDRIYGSNVQNVFISQGMTPLLIMEETFLGQRRATGRNSSTRIDIAQGQVLDFTWMATAEDYAGVIESYRYGWDVTDPSDEEDPNWAGPAGNSPLHRRAPRVSFGTGTHTLTIQATDNSGQLTRFVWVLEVVPVPAPEVQSPLLLVDDVRDQASNGWEGADHRSLDNDVYRDDFWWDTLAGLGGVEGFGAADVLDAETDRFGYREIVNYRVVLWTSRYAQNNFVDQYFKPYPDGTGRFTWLSSYQETVGNLFLVGSRILNEFIEELDWMMPWIFDTRETIYDGGTAGTFTIGFGTRTLPDGTEVKRGPERYPYQAMGIAMLDHTSPKYPIYRFPRLAQQARRASACVGMKGLILDPAFKSRYIPEGGAFPDTIYTDPVIDWADLVPAHRDALERWPWGDDEFYDANTVDRSTPWSPQDCDGEPCVEPMFQIYSRFDLVADLHAAAGDTSWPAPYFNNDDELRAKCGQFGLDWPDHRTPTTGRTTGFFSHKLVANKPSRRPDVVWGFDPYRFSRPDIRRAVQWVLGEHFGLTMKP